MERLRWTTPRPPCWAMAMARRDSVTVSMAADMRGVLRVMLRVRRVWVLTWVGTTSLYAGGRRTLGSVCASVTGGWMMIIGRCVRERGGASGWRGEVGSRVAL